MVIVHSLFYYPLLYDAKFEVIKLYFKILIVLLTIFYLKIEISLNINCKSDCKCTVVISVIRKGMGITG